MSERRRATLSGRWASGAERGRGSLVHVLEAGTPIDRNMAALAKRFESQAHGHGATVKAVALRRLLAR